MVILTDLSEVLIRGLYGTQDILAEKYGPLAGEAFWARHESTYGKFQELMRGKITEAEYWDYFFRGQSFPFDCKAVDKAFKNNLGRTIPDTLNMYMRIASYPNRVGSTKKIQGRPGLVMVSDHISERVPFLIKAHRHLFSCFSQKVWSFELGKVKSDPGYFNALKKTISIHPNECIFIDDSEANINNALISGVPHVLFRNAKQVEQVLSSRFGFDFVPER